VADETLFGEPLSKRLMARKLDRQIFCHSSFSEEIPAVDLFVTIITIPINFNSVLIFKLYYIIFLHAVVPKPFTLFLIFTATNCLLKVSLNKTHLLFLPPRKNSPLYPAHNVRRLSIGFNIHPKILYRIISSNIVKNRC
jgi:hypothetical protein